MTVQLIKGNLFSSKARGLVDPVNCIGTSGVSPKVKSAFGATHVAGSTRTPVDGKAAQAALEAAGLPVPLSVSKVAATLRASLNK